MKINNIIIIQINVLICGGPMCRIFCVGKNYLLHVKEMGHEAPESPVIFLKPYPSSLQKISASRISGNKVFLPGAMISNDIHQETEVVLRVGRDGVPTDKSECYSFIDGVSLGLDLTLRDVQAELKRLSLPWEKSKAFDGSAVVSGFIKYHFSMPTFNLDDLSFYCKFNGELQQHGNTKDMLFSVSDIILELSKYWQLKAGDLIFTGTPAGVCQVSKGDSMCLGGEIFEDVHLIFDS